MGKHSDVCNHIDHKYQSVMHYSIITLHLWHGTATLVGLMKQFLCEIHVHHGTGQAIIMAKKIIEYLS